MGDGSYRLKMQAAQAAWGAQNRAAQAAQRAKRAAQGAVAGAQAAENAMERVDRLITHVLDPSRSQGGMQRGNLVDFDAASGRHVTISADEGQALVRLTIAAMSAEAGGEAPQKEAVHQRMRTVMGRIASANNPKQQLAIETDAALTEIVVREKQISQKPSPALAVPVGKYGVTQKKMEAAEALGNRAADRLDALQPNVVSELKKDRELSALTLITMAVNPRHPTIAAFIKEASADAANDNALAVVNKLRAKVNPPRPGVPLGLPKGDRKPFIPPEKPAGPEGQNPPGDEAPSFSSLANPAEYPTLPAASVESAGRPAVAAARPARSGGMDGVQV